MIYLASPFSSDDPVVRKERVDRVCELTAGLLAEGRHVFSPIAYGAYLAELYGLRTDWGFWRKLDLDFLERCDEVWVYQLPGWDASVGVRAEIEHAQLVGRSVWYYREGRVWNTVG